MDASIIIPCYNSENTIKECIDSIILDSQNTHHNVEIIAVDDGSNDSTRDILRSYKDVKYIYIENMGPATARNRGAETARGEILLFTDSDCIVQPGWIDQMLIPFLENRHISAVKGAYRTHQEEITAQFCQLEFQERYRFLERQKFIDFVDTYSAAFKKDTFWEIGGFNESFPYPNNEDVDLSYRMASYSKLMVFNPKAVVIHKHKTKAIDYFKLKFSRAFWRMVVYSKYPEKIIRDSYTPYSLKIQMILLDVMILSLILSPFIKHAFSISIAAFGFFILSCIPFSVTGLKNSFSLFLVSFPMLFLRALALNLGILASLFPINLNKLLSIGLIIIDSLTIIASIILSYMAVSFLLYGSLFSPGIPIKSYLYAIPAVILLYLIILQSSGLYHIPQNCSGISYLFKVFSSSLVLTLSLASISYLFFLDYSRAVLVLIFPTVFTISITARILWFRFSEFLITSGYGTRRAVIVGINDTSRALAEKMINIKNLGYRFIGYIAGSSNETGQARIIGNINNLPNIIKSYRINDVFFSDPEISTDIIFDIISRSSYDIASFKIVTSASDILIKTVDIESISDIPLIDLKNIPPSFFYKLLKRLFDLAFALILIIPLLIPLFIFYLILMAFCDEEPVIKRTPSTGYKEKAFNIFTFNIDPLKKKGILKGIVYGLYKRLYIYQLPKLFNVFNGTMSFVGPGAIPNDSARKYKRWQRIRFEAIPGITGISQIMNRDHKDNPVRMLEYDFFYIRNRSLVMDLAILVKTIIYMLFKVL